MLEVDHFLFFSFFQGPPPGRSMDHVPGGFMGNQGRWTGMLGGPLRKGTIAILLLSALNSVVSRQLCHTPSFFLLFVYLFDCFLFFFLLFFLFYVCFSRSWYGESRRDAWRWARLG